MELIKVKDLKPHPRNKEFFDDIVGEQWEDFKNSVRQSNIIEPIVITTDLLIVSGHMRVKSCIELGIEEIPARIKHYSRDEIRDLEVEDIVLEELIIANIKNRAVPSNNAIKFGRCLKFLELINLDKQEKLPSGQFASTGKTQQDLANEIGISVDTWRRYKKLTILIPELQDMVMNDEVPQEVARKLFSSLSEQDQKKVLDIYTPEKLSEVKSSQIKEVIKEVEIIKEVYPDDYKDLLKVKDKYEVLEIREKDLQAQLTKQTIMVQNMKANDEGLAKAELKRKRIEEEYINVERKKNNMDRKILESEKKVHELDKLYGDATNTLQKQRQINDLIDKLKDTTKLVESKLIGFTPHDMGKDNYTNILKEYRICLKRAIEFVDELQGESTYIDAKEDKLIEYTS